MQPRDFLTFAQQCHTAMSTEASTRSCISRAYYAAWLAARDHLDAKGIQLPERNASGKRLGSHEQVIVAMDQIPHQDWQRFQSRMYNLKDLRRKADYDLMNQQVLTAASAAMALSLKVIDWIDNLP